MRTLYQEQAILWLTRAFDHTHPMTAEECLDNAIACLRMAAIAPPQTPPGPAPPLPED